MVEIYLVTHNNGTSTVIDGWFPDETAAARYCASRNCDLDSFGRVAYRVEHAAKLCEVPTKPKPVKYRHRYTARRGWYGNLVLSRTDDIFPVFFDGDVEWIRKGDYYIVVAYLDTPSDSAGFDAAYALAEKLFAWEADKEDTQSC